MPLSMYFLESNHSAFGRTVHGCLDISGITVICGPLRGEWVGSSIFKLASPFSVTRCLHCVCL